MSVQDQPYGKDNNALKNQKSTNSKLTINLRMIQIALPPASIAVISAFHPAFSTHAEDALGRVRGTTLWEPIHIALLIAILAFDASLLVWLRGPGSKASAIGHLGVWINAGFYSAFIGVDGLAATILSHLSPPPLAQQSVTALFASPLVASLGWIGGAGWILAAVAIMAQRRKSGASMFPPVFLLVGVVWLTASHAPPLGIIGGTLITVGAIWESTLALKP